MLPLYFQVLLWYVTCDQWVMGLTPVWVDHVDMVWTYIYILALVVYKTSIIMIIIYT